MTAYPDHNGRDAAELRSKRLWLLDMDGTIYLDNELFDGTLQMLEAVKAHGGRYVFITNNSSRSVMKYVEKVRGMGIPATAEDFYTSVQATAFLLNRDHPGKLVYVMGTRAMVEELRSLGVRVTEEVRDDIDVCLIGFDTELTSRKLRNTCEVLLKDIPYYGANPDYVCPVSFGFVPDCGSMAIMLKNATGKEPVFIGKPEPLMIDLVREKYGISREETVVVGDRLYTDIAAGVNAGVTAVCVLSGEASLKDIEASPVKPDFVFDSVKDIWQVLR